MTIDRNIPDTSSVGKDYKARYIAINGTNEPMQDVSVCHECAEVSWTNKVRADVLASGEATTSQTLSSRSLLPDLWDMCLTRGGNTYVKGDAKCNIPAPNADGLCVVYLNETTVQILTPRISRCSFFLTPRLIPFTETGVDEDGYIISNDHDRLKKTYGQGVNAEIKGSFVVVNATGGPITEVNIAHECDGKKESFPINGLLIDEVSARKEISSATWHFDYWDVSFKTSAGHVKSRKGKECGYAAEDSPQVCLFILYNESLSIVMPVSSPCIGNSY